MHLRIRITLFFLLGKKKTKKIFSFQYFRGMLIRLLLFLVGGARAHVSLLWPPGLPALYNFAEINIYYSYLFLLILVVILEF